MRSFLLSIICFSFYCGMLNAQVNCISNLKFSVDSFDVVVIEVNDENLKKFSIIENTGLDVHPVFNKKNNADSSLFLINASVSDASCKPIGYLNFNGNVVNAPNLADGKGNFFLKPNGALLLSKSDAVIVESSFIGTVNDIFWGVQSGPLLMNNGMINPNFTQSSTNLKVRCGVGIFVDNNGKKNLVFVKSINPVTFYAFTMLFQYRFNCSVALCLESAGCAMNLPYLKDHNQEVKKTAICRYIGFKY